MALFEDGVEEEQGEAGQDSTDAQIAEAEARLHEAGYYRMLMEAAIFGDIEDPIAQRVQKKVNDMARREIAAIIGGGTVDQGLKAQEAARLKALLQMSEEEVATLKLLLTDLTQQEVMTLRTFLTRVAQDPTVVRQFMGAAMKKPPTPPPAVRQLTAPAATPRPAIRTVGTPSQRRAPPAPTKPAPKQAPKPTKPAEGEGENGTRHAKLRSPTAPPFPTGDAFSNATQNVSSSSERASGRIRDQNIRGIANNEDPINSNDGETPIK